MAKKRVAKPQAAPSRRATVPPVNVIKLMGILGGTKTAAELGVSTTLLYKAKNEKAITQSIELAAAHALENLGKPERDRPAPAPQVSVPAPVQSHAGTTAFHVTVASSQADLFQRMAVAMGAIVVPA
jgi:hypothetical protein